MTIIITFLLGIFLGAMLALHVRSQRRAPVHEDPYTQISDCTFSMGLFLGMLSPDLEISQARRILETAIYHKLLYERLKDTSAEQHASVELTDLDWSLVHQLSISLLTNPGLAQPLEIWDAVHSLHLEENGIWFYQPPRLSRFEKDPPRTPVILFSVPTGAADDEYLN
jgi:hypothetical protein